MATTTRTTRSATSTSTPTLASVFSAVRSPVPAQDGRARVLSVAQLRSLGVPPSTITKRCRPGGPWRRLAPGVVLLGTGEPTRHQLLQAAVAYLGPESVITGIDALRAYGVRLPPPTAVGALVAAHRRLTPPAFVTVERTARLPAPVTLEGVPYAPPARAALDAARRETDLDFIRRLLTLPVQEGLCDLRELRDELEAGNQRGSAAVRAQLRTLTRTDQSDLRRTARQVIRHCPLPPPRWDTTVFTRDRRRLGSVDAWWDEVGLAWSIAPVDVGSERDRLALTAAGVVLVRTTPSLVRHHAEFVIAELVRGFRRAAGRPRPHVVSEARVAA